MPEPSDWLQMVITIKTRCFVCGKDVPPGPALWSKSAKASKHLTCVQQTLVPAESSPVSPSAAETKAETTLFQTKRLEELTCYLCGAKAGCNECSFLEDCITRMESKHCLCDNCAYGNQSMADAYEAYKKVFEQKMNGLNG